jgi:hypothetical protein
MLCVRAGVISQTAASFGALALGKLLLQGGEQTRFDPCQSVN